jgi:hypothetical protein
LKSDKNLPSKNNKQKNLEKKIIFVDVLPALPTPTLFRPFISILVWIAGRVADPHSIHPDPDPAF